MNLRHIIKFHALILIPVGIALYFVAFSYGCNKVEEKKEVKPVVTLENLQTAYNKEVKQEKMYNLFIGEAVKEKNKNVEHMYKAMARSEEIHAQNHAKLMRGHGVEPVQPEITPVVVGTIPQTMKMAMSLEESEYDAMYPNLIRSADAEKFPEASKQFQQSRDVDARHAELLKDAADNGGKTKVGTYFVCAECGYVLTSDKTDECPVCKGAKASFEKF